MVFLSDGHALGYDVLVVATGAVLQPEETEGMTGPGWGDRAFTFYDVQGASALAGAMERFEGGRLVVNVVDMPIKCPIAPLEFSFLADWYLRKRGIRKASEITFVTPLDGAFTKPTASAHLGGLLEQKGIRIETEFAAGEVDGEAGILRSYDGREVPFDLLATIPLHGGAPFVERSPGWATRSAGFPPTRPRCRRRPGRTSSCSGTRPTCRRRRRARWRTSRARCWRRTSSASWRGASSRRRSTDTPTASSRRASTRPC